MRSHWKYLLIVGLLSLSASSYAQQVDVNSLHYSQVAKQTRMVFDVSASPKHRVFVQNNPAQLVIEIKNAKLGQALIQPSASHPLFANIHVLEKTKDNLRLAVDLKESITSKNFSLSSNNKNEHKLIIDLTSKNAPVAHNKIIASKDSVQPAKKETPVLPIEPPKTLASKAESTFSRLQNFAQQFTSSNKQEKIVIAIDAGHGGNDSGAHGAHGTEEKQVVFAIAKKLATLINSQPDMKAVMVRKGDYYVGLRKRMQIARAAHANLFISIHANAFQDTTVKGLSVYVLSRSSASSEAALWLAKNENASDLIGGVSLEDKEDVLASVLLDLSQSATEQASADIAKSVLKHCSAVGETHKDAVQHAGFMVLKSPDIPSILVETAFISNPSEEENLLNDDYQTKMATAIFGGVHNYFTPSSPTADTKVAALSSRGSIN